MGVSRIATSFKFKAGFSTPDFAKAKAYVDDLSDPACSFIMRRS
jgi:hypothetical protein